MGEHRGILRFLRKQAGRTSILAVEEYGAATNDAYADLGFTAPSAPAVPSRASHHRRSSRAA